MLVNAQPDMEVIGEAGDGEAAINEANRLKPDILLMDISMPLMDGFAATKTVLRDNPRTRVLMLTGSNARADVAKARRVGAAGYVTKDRIAAELIEAIVEIASRS